MKPGLVSISFRQSEPLEIIRIVAEAQLRGIEWGGDVHVPHGDLKRAREVGRATVDAGLEVASYGSYYAFDECDSTSSTRGPSMRAVLDTAEALGAPAVRVWAGRRNHVSTPASVREQIVQRAREFAEAAGNRGMRIDFEFHADTLTETAASTCTLLEAIDHPAVKTLWQPPLQMSPEDRLAGLRRVKPWVTNVHCNHFGQDPWPHVHTLEEGTLEWADYLSEFANETTDRWILIEHVREHAEAAFRRDAATLRGWLDAGRP